MKALILAGGKATRLEPLTINTPKALIPVLNVPFLEYVIRNLAGHGIEEMVLAMGHLSQPIEDHLGNGSQFGVRLHYSIEDTPLGSAGAAKNAEMYLGGTFLVLNGDIFADMDFTAMIDLHRKKKAKATIAVTPVDDPTRYGLVDTDEQGRVTRFLEKPKPEEITTNMINAGAWLVEHDILSQIPFRTQFSFERNVFPQLLDQGEPVYAYPISGYWIDMGTPETYLQLHRDLLGGKSKHYTHAEEIMVGEKTDIHHTVECTGPVLIGDSCSIGQGVRLIGPVVIGNGCTIGEDSVIQESVIWCNVSLGRGVSLRNCVIADSCQLDAGSRAEDSVLGDNVTVVSNYTLKPGSKIGPGTTVKPE